MPPIGNQPVLTATSIRSNEPMSGGTDNSTERQRPQRQRQRPPRAAARVDACRDAEQCGADERDAGKDRRVGRSIGQQLGYRPLEADRSPEVEPRDASEPLEVLLQQRPIET